MHKAFIGFLICVCLWTFGLAATSQTLIPADWSIFTGDGESLQQKYDDGTLGVQDTVHLSGIGAPTAPCSNIGKDRYTDTATNAEWYCSSTDTWTQFAAGSGAGGDLVPMNPGGKVQWPQRPFDTGQRRGGSEMLVDRPLTWDQSVGTFRYAAGGVLPNTWIGAMRYNLDTDGSGSDLRWYQLDDVHAFTVGGGWVCRSSGPLNGVQFDYGDRACTTDNSVCTSDVDCPGGTCKTVMHNCVIVDGGYFELTNINIKYENNIYHASPMGFMRIASSTQPGTCSYGSCTGGPTPGARCRSSDASACGAGGTCTQPTCTTDAECSASGAWCEYVQPGEVLTLDSNEARIRVTPVCVQAGVQEVPSATWACPYEDELNALVYGQSTVCSQNFSGSVCRTTWTGATSGQPRFAARDVSESASGTRSDPSLDAGDFDSDGYLLGRMPWAQFHDAIPSTTTTSSGNQLTLDSVNTIHVGGKSFVSVYDPNSDEQSFLFRTRSWNRRSNALNVTGPVTRAGPSNRVGSGPIWSNESLVDWTWENDRIAKHYDSHPLGAENSIDVFRGYLAPLHNGQAYGDARGLKLSYLLRPRAENAELDEWFSQETECGFDGQYTSVQGSATIANRAGCRLTRIVLSDKVTYPSAVILDNRDLELDAGSSWANMGTQLAGRAVVVDECPNLEGLGGGGNPSACDYIASQTNQSGSGNVLFGKWFSDVASSMWVWDSPDGADGDRKWLSSRKLPSGRFALELTDNESIDVQSPVAIVDPLTVSGASSAMQWDASQGRLVGYPEGSMLHYAVQDLSGYVNRSMCRRVADGYTLTAARAYATAAVEVTLEDKAVPGDGAAGSALTTTTVAGTDWTDLPITTASVSGPANICVALSGTIPAGAMGVEVEGAWAPLGVSVPANSVYWQDFESTLGADCFDSVTPTDCDCTTSPCPLVGTQSLQIGPVAAALNTRFQVNGVYSISAPESLVVATFVWRAKTGFVNHSVLRIVESTGSLSDSQVNQNADLQLRIGCEGAGLSGQAGPFVEDQLYNVMAVWDYRVGQKVARLFVDERLVAGIQPWGVTEVLSQSGCTQIPTELTGIRMQANLVEGEIAYVDDVGICDQTGVGSKPTGPCQ